MSDSWLIVVPVDPFAAPPAGAVEAARTALAAALPAADEVVAVTTPNPHFVDAGANFETIACPACGADAFGWWGDAMDAATQDDFRDLAVTAPCCGTTTTLADLTYDWPQAFARVALRARNPEVEALPPEATAGVEARLGLPTRVVRARL